MNTTNTILRPTSYMVIAVAALLWNLIGLAMFILQVRMTPETLAALPPEQQAIHAATPSWINVLFGIAVIAGVLGSLGLLLKKRWSVPLLLLSMLGVIAQLLAAYAVTPAFALTGFGGLVLPIVLVLISGFLWLYARKAATRGWLA